MSIRLTFIFAILGVSVSGMAGQAPVADAPAKLLSSTPFEMSKDAERAGIDGALVLAVSIGKSGEVKKVEIIAGPAWPCASEPKRELADLRRAVKENVMGAKFSPTIKDGKPQSSDLQLNFKIGEAYQTELRKREREDAVRNGVVPPMFVKAGVINGKALKLPRPGVPCVGSTGTYWRNGVRRRPYR